MKIFPGSPVGDPEEDMVDAMVRKLAGLERLVPAARKYLSSTGISDAILSTLEFCGLPVARAHPEWVRNIQFKSNLTLPSSVFSDQIVSGCSSPLPAISMFMM